MASRDSVEQAAVDMASPSKQGVVLQQGTTSIASGGGGSSQGSSVASSFQGITNEEALAILHNYLKEVSNGGTKEYQQQVATRNQALQETQSALGQYTTQKAFEDAAGLMAQNLQVSQEKNAPALAKSIQGAGTSSSSMQGLLAGKIASDAALNASALGAEQAKVYAQTSSQLRGIIEALTKVDPQAETNLLKALDLLKVSTSSDVKSNSSVQQGDTRISTGGASYFQPISGNKAPIGDVNGGLDIMSGTFGEEAKKLLSSFGISSAT